MFSQTVEYALRAVMCLAGSNGEPVSSERISQQMQIPRAYLSKIMRDLVVAGLVKSLLGPNGGFALCKSADKVCMLELVNAVDPLRRIEKCPLGRPDHVKLCPLHRQMDETMEQVEKSLSSVTIGQLAAEDADRGRQAMLRPLGAKPVSPRNRHT